MTNKIKIVAVKFGGLCAGGSEKGLQTILANLPKEKFEVDYFYCDAAPYIGSNWKHPDTDLNRKTYMEEKGINLIKFNVEFKDVRTPTHEWVDTNFWDLFDENKYDILQTVRAGHPECPFNKINKIPQIDLITLPGMAERKSNVYKTVHISNYQAKTWIKAGGDQNKIEVIPLFDDLPEKTTETLHEELGIDKNVFIYGLHQRVDDGIFSPIPLEAYSKIEDEETAFIMMGGSKKYIKQAKALKLKHFYHIPHSGNNDKLHKFLNTFDVLTHGRKDGETFSMVISDALYYGKPCISHTAPAMGHLETIGPAGKIVQTKEEYVEELINLKNNKEYYSMLSKNAFSHFENKLSMKANIEKWVKLYEECYKKIEKDNMSDKDFWNEMW